MMCSFYHLALALLLASFALAGGKAQHGQVVHITVHGAALEHNLVGDSPDRDVSVYLPPGYDSGTQRYPVIYLLHGYTGSDLGWMNPAYVGLPELMDHFIAQKGSVPMIVVMPNAFNRFGGSFYTNSELSGGWEDFIVRDLVGYVDAHYRTVANAGARAIVGHSMGGYGALRIGMRHPEIFTVAYGLSPCCIEWDEKYFRDGSVKAQRAKNLQAVVGAGFEPQFAMALAAAFSPNIHNPPLGVDWPFDAQGQPVPAVVARWKANLLDGIAASYAGDHPRLRALGFDVGRSDGLLDDVQHLDAQMKKLGIAHTYAEYDGDHNDHIRDRMEQVVLPMVAKQLTSSREPLAPSP